jgi:hypothetical protein
LSVTAFPLSFLVLTIEKRLFVFVHEHEFALFIRGNGRRGDFALRLRQKRAHLNEISYGEIADTLVVPMFHAHEIEQSYPSAV